MAPENLPKQARRQVAFSNSGFHQASRREWEEAFLPPEELEKYADSVGHQPARAGTSSFI
jgi:hypothetical protein